MFPENLGQVCLSNFEITNLEWGTLKTRNLLNRHNSTVRRPIALNFYMRNCQNLLPVKFKIANGAKIFSIVFLIPRERLKIATSNLVCTSTRPMRSNFENMQKLDQKRRDPVYATYNLNLRTSANISQVAKPIRFKFST